MKIFDFFRKKEKPKPSLNQIQEVAGKLIVISYRKLAASAKCAPTSKTTDQKIIEIYQQVGSEFRKASNQRNERIPAGNLNSIVFKFLQVYELMGDKMFNEHLKYEVDKYIQEGLREDYKKELKLF